MTTTHQEMEKDLKRKMWADTLIIVTLIIGFLISTVIILPWAGLDSLLYWNWMFWLADLETPRIVALMVVIFIIILVHPLAPTITYRDNKRKRTKLRRAVKIQGSIVYIYCSGGIVIKTHKGNIYRGVNDWGVFNDYKLYQDGDEIELETTNWELHNEQKLRHEFEIADEQRALTQAQVRDLLRQGHKFTPGLIEPRYLDRSGPRYYNEYKDTGGDDDGNSPRTRPRV